MRQHFDAIMAHILAFEGGYVDHPQDPGSATNHGITLATLQRWRERPIGKLDVQRLGATEAKAIFHLQYWHPIWGDDLPSGVDCSVMDFAVNAGVARAVRLLQELVHTTRDGVMGPQTLKIVTLFVDAHGAKSLIADYADARATYYRSLPTFATFGTGWLRRTTATEQASLALAEHDGMAPVTGS